MSLHAAEVADHLDLIRYRGRRLWRPAFLGDPVISGALRKRKKRRYVLLGQGLAAAGLVLSIYALYLVLSRGNHQALARQAVVSARRHRLREPGEYEQKPVLEALLILPISDHPINAEDHETVPKENVTVVLPVDLGSYAHLPSLLAPFLITANRPGEIIVASPPTIVGEVEAVVNATLLTLRHVDVPLRVTTWQDDLSARVGWLHVATTSGKKYVLILDERGSQEISPEGLSSLLSPKALQWPVGPRGVSFSPTNVSCTAHGSSHHLPVAFLMPPFAISRELLREAESTIRMNDLRVWFSLGERVAGMTGTGFGGLAWTPSGSPASALPVTWCAPAAEQVLDPSTTGILNPRQAVYERYRTYQHVDLINRDEHPIRIVLATKDELQAFAPTICRMASRGRSLRIYVVSASSDTESSHVATSAGGCHIHYDVAKPSASSITPLQTWLGRHCRSPSIIIHTLLRKDEALLLGLMRIYATTSSSTMIWLPTEDLSVSAWMAELNSNELQAWHAPHIDLSVITNNRPASLQRLLTSLQQASYFGDKPILTISLEETADPDTLNAAQRINWPNGGAQIRHRVIHGGLLPAVVEAWYPYTNDSYGVLLEDDVEVSPMFYAWLKFAILRYRYGQARHEASSMFGVSLYQAKHTELRPEGRRPFNAQVLFTNSSIRFPHTPYLSQVPCSWGAVFFPEHWREFHAYLSARLSDAGQALTHDIVPGIRSNKWPRSWKRYFIEMTYLRGYVMLYPNFDHFVSLSTNHLEPGEHAHDLPDRLLNKKKAQFRVPLMGVDMTDYGVHLLDLPQGDLPAWEELPVLDLWGNLASLDLLKWRGAYRHEEVTTCHRLLALEEPSTYNAAELLCLHEEDEEDEDDDDDMLAVGDEGSGEVEPE